MSHILEEGQSWSAGYWSFPDPPVRLIKSVRDCAVQQENDMILPEWIDNDFKVLNDSGIWVQRAAVLRCIASEPGPATKER